MIQFKLYLSLVYWEPGEQYQEENPLYCFSLLFSKQLLLMGQRVIFDSGWQVINYLCL